MIVIFTGPPSSGKDTVGYNFRIRHIIFDQKEFKAPLIRMVKAAFNISDSKWAEMYTEKGKNLKYKELEWRSPRETLIAFSEEMMKPFYGQNIFGRLCAEQMDPWKDYYITDGGFKEEFEPLVKKFGAGNIKVIRLNREGTSYEGDSRHPYNPEWFPSVKFKEIDNNRNIEEVLDDVDDFVFTS